MIDLVYVSHNRYEYTVASFLTLVENTEWSLVKTLYLMDDASTDGTREWLYEAGNFHVPATVATANEPFGSPVGAMNRYLDVRESARADAFVKIDNDVIVPPGWLNVLTATARVNPNIDVLGFEPGFGDGFAPIGDPDVPRVAKPAPHVGGVGLIRTRIFRGGRRRMKPHDRWYGWTQAQRQWARCAWLSPDIPSFLLDHVDAEPWKTLAAEYVERGWARAWSDYFDPPADYHEWWTKAHAETAA